MAKHILKFIGGFTVGFGIIFSCDYTFYYQINKLIGIDLEKNQDFLRVSNNLSLDERRYQFRNVLKERGQSFRVINMIGDANRDFFEIKASTGKDSYDLELKILEEKFRDYYPELFDENNGREFIESLNLKTKCDDHDIPKVLRLS